MVFVKSNQYKWLALTLFMPWIGTNHPNHALAAYHFAFAAYLLD
jgi:hypothetical protein